MNRSENDTLKVQNEVEVLLQLTQHLSIDETLQMLSLHFPEQVTFMISFGFEDQLITHEIFSNQIPIRIFTLDTGRFFPETYSVWNATNQRYQTNIQAYYPDTNQIQHLVSENGPNAFL